MEQFRLKVFEAVWTTGSHTKAARQLGITQPAVSQNIAELEKELGTALFTRTGPTPAAEVFIQLVRKVLKGYEDIRVLFNPEAAEYGTVRIRADRSATEYALPKVLKVLRAAHPAVIFEVLPPEETTGDIVTAEAPGTPTTTDGTAVTPDVIITTVPTEQNGTITLRFEVFGPASPFVEAVRLLLAAPDSQTPLTI